MNHIMYIYQSYLRRATDKLIILSHIKIMILEKLTHDCYSGVVVVIEVIVVGKRKSQHCCRWGQDVEVVVTIVIFVCLLLFLSLGLVM